METRPKSNCGSPEELSNLRRKISLQGLTGAANDSKWTMLLDGMRTREGSVPQFRYRTIDGHVSRWDGEWWYHVPLPMMMVRWLEIRLIQDSTRKGMLRPKEDCPWVLELLDDAKFDYEITDGVLVFSATILEIDLNQVNKKANKSWDTTPLALGVCF